MSFANSLSNLCEKIPGTDIDTITQTIGADKRISPYYLKGGLSFGGTCFPRDIKAYLALAKKYNFKAELIEAVEKVNNFQDRHLAKVVLKYIKTSGSKKVSILGLSFKPNTPVIVESPAIKLIKTLLKQNIKITVYDPLAMENTREIFRDKINYADSVKDCISKSNICVITTQAKEFKDIKPGWLKPKTVLIDCWRTLDSSKYKGNAKYLALGINY